MKIATSPFICRGETIPAPEKLWTSRSWEYARPPGMPCADGGICATLTAVYTLENLPDGTIMPLGFRKDGRDMSRIPRGESLVLQFILAASLAAVAPGTLSCAAGEVDWISAELAKPVLVADAKGDDRSGGRVPEHLRTAVVRPEPRVVLPHVRAAPSTRAGLSR